MMVATRELIDELEVARRDLADAHLLVATLVRKAGGRVEITYEDRMTAEEGARLAVWDDMERMCTVLALSRS